MFTTLCCVVFTYMTVFGWITTFNADKNYDED